MNYPNSLRQMIWLALGVLCGCCACCARSAREPPDLATPTVPRPTRNLAPPTPTSWWSNTRAAGTSDVHVKPIDQVIGTGRVLDLALSPDGDTLAVAGSAGITIYRADTFKWVRTLGVFTDRFDRIAGAIEDGIDL